MAINKINIKNKIYDFGGSEAKLVATGRYLQENQFFKLDNPLEENKLYYAIIKVNSYDYEFAGTLKVTSNMCSNLILMRDISDEELVVCEMFYSFVSAISRYMIEIYAINGSELIIANSSEEDNNIIKVYELPFTIGGAE